MRDVKEREGMRAIKIWNSLGVPRPSTLSVSPVLS